MKPAAAAPVCASVNKPDTAPLPAREGEESATRALRADSRVYPRTRSRRFNQQNSVGSEMSLREAPTPRCSIKPHKSAMHAGFIFELMRTKLASCATLGPNWGQRFSVSEIWSTASKQRSPPKLWPRTMSPVSVMHCLLQSAWVRARGDTEGSEPYKLLIRG